MTFQDFQASRLVMPLDEGKHIFGEEFISDACVELLIYESSDTVGYIEKLNDDTYLCTVANMGIHDADLTKVEQFLFDTWFDTYKF